MQKERRARLSTEISKLTVFSSVFAILFLGIVFIAMFVVRFAPKTKDDMRYFISNKGRQFDDVIQFIQDGAVSIRHNHLIDAFFHNPQYDKALVENELGYCMDLFSSRNIASHGFPFVSSIHVFNNNDQYVKAHYYPMTLSDSSRLDMSFLDLKQRFDQSPAPYASQVEGMKMNLCLRIFDAQMEQMGICVVVIEISALQEMFSEGEKYHGFSWSILSGDGEFLIGGGEQPLIGPSAASISPPDENAHLLCHQSASGFGLQTHICVDKNNIYLLLQPTIMALIVTMVIVLSLIVLLILAAGRRFTRPFERMTAEISTFGRENLSARMQDFPIDEFHQISVAFNKMATRIDHLITQVYEKQILATRSQVKFLQAQINPHFQFNVLSMLSLTAKKAGNEDLYAYLHAFSKLIQGKIFRDREIKIPVRGELELVNFYLQLQKGRFQEALDYEIHCSEERLLDCLIPKLLIEPLVENAVAHGLEPKGGQGKIDIHIDSRDDKLVISVSDNGVGFDSQCIETASPREGSSHTHTSLANTRRLLDILYQDNFEMTINGQKDRGTHIAIAIPMEEQKQCGQ